MKLKNVISILGSPGTGKSTLAAGLFYQMKLNHFNVELVTEYAKDLTWEDRVNILQEDQLYILAQQHRRFYRLIDKVDYIITDSPLILGLLYFDPEKMQVYSEHLFRGMVHSIFNKYPNLNIFLTRNKEAKYQHDGRFQSFDEAVKIDEELETLIKFYKIPHIKVEVVPHTLEKVTNIIEETCDIKFPIKVTI